MDYGYDDDYGEIEMDHDENPQGGGGIADDHSFGSDGGSGAMSLWQSSSSQGGSFLSSPMSFGQALSFGGSGFGGSGFSSYGMMQQQQQQQMNVLGWGQPALPEEEQQQWKETPRKWKRNADEAELGQFTEVGTNLDDLEVGHNAAKIRTMDFDEAATMTKSGYVIDEAFLAFEKLKKERDEEWVEATSAISCQPQPLKTTLKDLKNQLGDKPVKFAKRRTRRCTDDENWEDDLVVTRFGNNDDLWD